MSRNPFHRAAPVPHDVAARVPLGKGERVLAAAETGDGSWLVGTRDALVVLRSTPNADENRIPWQVVERADWDSDAERLRVVEVGEYGAVRPSYEFAIGEPGRLLELIRERVTATVVLQRRVQVDGSRGLSVVARRAPHDGDEITWAYEFDRGVDPDDPAVRTAAERGLQRAAEELGL